MFGRIVIIFLLTFQVCFGDVQSRDIEQCKKSLNLCDAYVDKLENYVKELERTKEKTYLEELLSQHWLGLFSLTFVAGFAIGFTTRSSR